MWKDRLESLNGSENTALWTTGGDDACLAIATTYDADSSGYPDSHHRHHHQVRFIPAPTWIRSQRCDVPGYSVLSFPSPSQAPVTKDLK